MCVYVCVCFFSCQDQNDKVRYSSRNGFAVMNAITLKQLFELAGFNLDMTAQQNYGPNQIAHTIYRFTGVTGLSCYIPPEPHGGQDSIKPSYSV